MSDEKWKEVLRNEYSALNKKVFDERTPEVVRRLEEIDRLLMLIYRVEEDRKRAKEMGA